MLSRPKVSFAVEKAIPLLALAFLYFLPACITAPVVTSNVPKTNQIGEHPINNIGMELYTMELFSSVVIMGHEHPSTFETIPSSFPNNYVIM